MTTKTMKTILFASLIVAMILPFSGMQGIAFADADKKKQVVTDEPETYDYLKKLMKDTGTYVKEKKTKDNKDAKNTDTVKKINSKKYEINSVFVYEGEVVNDQTIVLTKNKDGSINMINEKHDFDVDFYKSDKTIQTVLSNGISKLINKLLPQVFAGSGNSNGSGGNIALYDSEYGTPGTLYLSDAYTGCYPLTQGDFEATVSSTVVDVNWQAHPFYWHWCIIPHEFSDGEAQYGTSEYDFGMSERTGSHAFTHSGGTTWYSVSVDFFYGSW